MSRAETFTSFRASISFDMQRSSGLAKDDLGMVKTWGRAVLLALACLLAATAWAQRWSPEYEKKVGDEVAAEVEKQWKVYDDKATVEKLTAMTEELSHYTARPDVKYHIKLLDTKEENAFSIPGGGVYVTKGLLASVQSDDEIAGVLAHEISHNSTYDSLDGAEKSKKLFMGSIAATLAAVLVGAKPEMIGGVWQATDFYRRGILAGYSIEIETRADRNGMAAMLKSTKYNPVGLLTFMERLAADERGRPRIELGVFQTHPMAMERVKLLTGYLNDAGVDINRRATTKWEKPVVEDIKVGDKSGLRLKLWGKTVLETASAGGEASLKDRGAKMVTALTGALASGIEAYEIKASVQQGQPCVMARRQVVIPIVADDAPAGKTSQDVAQGAAQSLRDALYSETLGRMYRDNANDGAAKKP